jgi:hypothetical protein
MDAEHRGQLNWIGLRHWHIVASRLATTESATPAQVTMHSVGSHIVGHGWKEFDSLHLQF